MEDLREKLAVLHRILEYYSDKFAEKVPTERSEYEKFLGRLVATGAITESEKIFLMENFENEINLTQG